MPFAACPNCGNTVCDAVTICPHCGYDIGANGWRVRQLQSIEGDILDLSDASLDCDKVIFFDSIKQFFVWDTDSDGDTSKPQENSRVVIEPHRYSSVVSASFEDDAGLASNMGAAAVGGLLFGGAGAIVGASRKSKRCSELLAKITMRDEPEPCLIVNFLNAQINCNTDEFSEALENARQCISKLSLIVSSEIEAPNQLADNYSKLRELKSLLDDGVITEADFVAAKKKALGI